jgi:hypothetical protein
MTFNSLRGGCFFYKSDKQITKNDKGKHIGDTGFNVKNPSNTEGKKTTSARQPAKLYYIKKCLQTPWVI